MFATANQYGKLVTMNSVYGTLAFSMYTYLCYFATFSARTLPRYILLNCMLQYYVTSVRSPALKTGVIKHNVLMVLCFLI